MRLRSLVMLGMSAALALSLPAFAQAPPVSPTNQVMRQAAVTPADNTPLPGGTTQGIYVGSASACNLAFIAANDTAAVTWLNVSPGLPLPIRAKVVMATNTTCTNIVALYW